MRPRDEPSVIAAAAELIARLGGLDDELARTSHPVVGAASVFIGQVHSGESSTSSLTSAGSRERDAGCLAPTTVSSKPTSEPA